MFFSMKKWCYLSLLPLGLPGGNQVDGLPPAASTDRIPSAEDPLRTYSEKILKFRIFRTFEVENLKISSFSDRFRFLYVRKHT